MFVYVRKCVVCLCVCSYVRTYVCTYMHVSPKYLCIYIRTYVHSLLVPTYCMYHNIIVHAPCTSVLPTGRGDRSYGSEDQGVAEADPGQQ